MITAEYLQEQIANMQAVITAHTGAIEFATHLLSVLEGEKSMTIDEFAQAIGGPGAVAEIQPLESE